MDPWAIEPPTFLSQILPIQKGKLVTDIARVFADSAAEWQSHIPMSNFITH
jgi:hypothetical protein